MDVAAAQLGAAHQKPEVDAISVMTEVSAQEVRELLHAGDDATIHGVELTMNAATRILVGWHTDRDYIGPYGLVQDLQFSIADANSRKDVRSFSDLSRRYCEGYPPRALLDELIRTLCVEDLGNGFYRALSRSYVPEQLSPESIRHLAKVLHSMAETLEVNLRAAAESRRLERAVFADFGLRRDDLSAFDKYIRERSQIFADDVDNWLSTRSLEGQPDVVQTGIGFYHYIANEEDERDYGNTHKN